MTWFSEHRSSIVCSPELSCLSELSFLITLSFPEQSAQVYIHSGDCKWVFIQIGQYLTYFLPFISCILTFPLYIFTKGEFHPPGSKTRGEVFFFSLKNRLLQQEKCMNQPEPADCQRSWNSLRPSSLAYSLYIWHLTSKAQSKEKIRSWFSAEKYHPDAPFLMLALQLVSLREPGLKRSWPFTHWPSKQMIQLLFQLPASKRWVKKSALSGF